MEIGKEVGVAVICDFLGGCWFVGFLFVFLLSFVGFFFSFTLFPLTTTLIFLF